MLLLRSVAHRMGPIIGPWLNVLHILSQSKARIEVHDLEDLQVKMDPETLPNSTRYSSATATNGDLRYLTLPYMP